MEKTSDTMENLSSLVVAGNKVENNVEKLKRLTFDYGYQSLVIIQ